MAIGGRPALDVSKFPAIVPPDTLEDDIREFIPKKATGIGNSTDMNRVKELLHNGVTAAHKDTCNALDKIVADATELMNRLMNAVNEHKHMLEEEGQKIAVQLEGAIQELTRTVEWVEKQGPNLRNPQYNPPQRSLPQPESDLESRE